ncbi:MAG: DUF3887 domain-containing protein [Tissierellia bacterium]|nr:DUF3887 domain-containing protein [Tissierellia bacterium]
MKKHIYILISLVLILGVSACTKGSIPSEEKETYKSLAEDIIQKVQSYDFESLEDISTDELKKALTEETTNKIKEILAPKGAFQSFDKAKFTTRKDPHTQLEYILVQYKVKYEEDSVIYSLTFDKEKKLAGIFLK